MDLHQHLSVAENGDFNFIKDQRLLLFDQNGGGCFQIIKEW